MEFRVLTDEEIETIPDAFYSDVDKMQLGARYRPEMAGKLIGAFDGDELVGIQGAIIQIHAAPIWVTPRLRGRSAEVREGLWSKVSETVRDWGGKFVFMHARQDTPQVSGIIAKHRGRLFGTAYLLEVE